MGQTQPSQKEKRTIWSLAKAAIIALGNILKTTD